VTIQDPKGMHWGGALGGPIFKEVMSFVLQSQGVAPTQDKIKKVALNEAQLLAQNKVIRVKTN
jgi:cell division protein FtsI (penicillin-binding protein 3)